MTISPDEPLRSVEYISTGGQVVFPYPFTAFREAEVSVVVRPAMGTPWQPLTYGVDYAVQINSLSAGGSVTLTTPRPTGWRVIVFPSYASGQRRAFSNQSALYFNEVERALDEVTAGVRQIGDRSRRSPAVEQFYGPRDLTLAAPVPGQVLVGTADGWRNGPSEGAISDAAGNAATAAAAAVSAAASELSARNAAVDVHGATLWAGTVPDLLADTATSYPVGTIFGTRQEGYSYKVLPPITTAYDAITAGGVKLQRLRQKRFILAYSQSNFVRRTPGQAWKIAPPSNLFVWNGGHWNGDLEPPVGTQFVPATDLAPQIPVSYAAELARGRPNEDWYLVIVARGGTGIRALAGMRYVFLSATTGSPPAGGLRFNPTGNGITYNSTDASAFKRFLTGGQDLGTSAFYPARIETVSDGGARFIEFKPTAEVVDKSADIWSQPFTETTRSAGWPPTNGTNVILYPGEPRMRNVMTDVVTAAFTAANIAPARRRFDKVVIWPTEADVFWPEAYRVRDFNYLMTVLTPWTERFTDYLITLPWPYQTSIAATLKNWWSAIRSLVREDKDHRTLVSLAESGIENWDADLVHASEVGREDIGYLMRKSEQTGGGTLTRLDTGEYLPVITLPENIDVLNPSTAMWHRVGDVVTVSGTMGVKTNTVAAAGFTMSLPIPTDIWNNHQLNGMGVALSTPQTLYVGGQPGTGQARFTYAAGTNQTQIVSYQFSYIVRT